MCVFPFSFGHHQHPGEEAGLRAVVRAVRVQRRRLQPRLGGLGPLQDVQVREIQASLIALLTKFVPI